MASGTEKLLRVTRSKQAARTSYNRMSRWYDALAGGSEQKYCELGLQKLGAGAGELILEIGFGTGRAILALAQAVGDTGRVYGLDLSDGMLAIAQSRVHRLGLGHRVELQRGDALQLSYPVDFFDAVFACFTLELFDNPEIPVVLGECHRTLRDRGRLCIVSLAREEPPNLMPRLYEWAHRALPSYVDCRPIFVRQAVEQAGFSIQAVTRKTMWGLPVEIVLAIKPSTPHRRYNHS